MDGITLNGTGSFASSLTKEHILDDSGSSNSYRTNKSGQGHVNKAFVDDEASELEDELNEKVVARQEVDANDDKRDSGSDDGPEKKVNGLQGNGITQSIDTVGNDDNNVHGNDMVSVFV